MNALAWTYGTWYRRTHTSGLLNLAIRVMKSKMLSFPKQLFSKLQGICVNMYCVKALQFCGSVSVDKKNGNAQRRISANQKNYY